MSGEEMGRRLENAAFKLIITVFTLVVLGTVAIPIVLAYLYTWRWLLFYPVCLLVFLIYVFKVSKGDKANVQGKRNDMDSE